METLYNSIKKELNKKISKENIDDISQLKTQLSTLNKWVINNIYLENYRTISSIWSRNFPKLKYILNDQNIQKPKTIKESISITKKLINKSWLIKSEVISDNDYIAAIIKIQKDQNLSFDAIFGNQMIKYIYDNIIFQNKPHTKIEKLNTRNLLSTPMLKIDMNNKIKSIDFFESRINNIKNKLWSRINDPIFSFMSDNAISNTIKSISSNITEQNTQYIYDGLFGNSVRDQDWMANDIQTIPKDITNNRIIKKYIDDTVLIHTENNYNKQSDDIIVNWFFQTLKIIYPSLADSIFWQKIQSNNEYKYMIFKYFLLNSGK